MEVKKRMNYSNLKNYRIVPKATQLSEIKTLDAVTVIYYFYVRVF